MSFNGSGTFQINTAGQPVVANTLIESTVFNAFADDIATGLSTCITKDGQTTVTANIPFAGFFLTNAGLRAPNGSVGTPSIAFQNETDCGFYVIGTNNVGFSLAGAKVVDFLTTGISVVGDITLSGGDLICATATTFNLINTQATTLNIGGAATTMAVGAATSATTWTGQSFTVTGANSTNNTALAVINTSNAAAASHSYVDVQVGGTTSTGDPQLRLTIPSGTSWYVGVDNSDSDKFVIGTGTTVGTNGIAWIASLGVTVGKASHDDAATAGVEIRAGGSAFLARVSSPLITVNRLTDDGQLIVFQQAGATEGDITVSGTTVSLTGAHLARWSQWETDDAPFVYRGSVLTNLDAMCGWGKEDNEQLNRMAISSVAGDRNVAGVFDRYDTDDQTFKNDFYCAQQGDFVIRIGAGDMVYQGALLESAGNGCARVQTAPDLPAPHDFGDWQSWANATRDALMEEFRHTVGARTLGKVTSSFVSAQYKDGSYAVPAVVYAG